MILNRIWLSAVFAVTVVCSAGAGPAFADEPAPNYAPAKADAFLAINDPDQFAWQLFCAICAPADKTDPHAIIWEIWPEQHRIFDNPAVAPQWPGPQFRGKKLHPSKQHFARNVEAASRQEREKGSPVPKPRDGVANEEVRDNKDAKDENEK